MKIFRFHWLDGTTTLGKGQDAADALAKSGFGAGALQALDYWEEVEMKGGATPK